MIRYIGAPPKSFLKLCRRPEAFFDENGEYFLICVYNCADVLKEIGDMGL